MEVDLQFRGFENGKSWTRLSTAFPLKPLSGSRLAV